MLGLLHKSVYIYICVCVSVWMRGYVDVGIRRGREFTHEGVKKEDGDAAAAAARDDLVLLLFLILALTYSWVHACTHADACACARG